MRIRLGDRDTSARLPDALTVALLAVLSVVVTYNAFHYPSFAGFDADVDLRYAHILLTEWRIPGELANNYTPPGFFLVAGPLVELGGPLGLADRADLAQLLDGAFAVGSAVLLALLCGVLFPGRPWLRVAAVAVFVACPTVLKTGAMFHPQPLSALLATLAVFLAARMVARRRYGLWAALALGLVTGAGQLVRSVGVWVLGVVLVSLLVAALVHGEERREAVRALVVVGVVGVVVAAPWYLVLEPSQAKPIFAHSNGAVGGAPSPVRTLASSGGRPTPDTSSRSPWFYVDTGLPQLVTAPHRQALRAGFWPILYADMWGDYYGNWSWDQITTLMSPRIERRLTVQMLAGALPTFLALVGFVAVGCLAVARVRTRPELLLVPLTAGTALLAALYYAYSFPSPDSDTVKALFLLPGLPAFAICFGFAVDVVGRRSRALAAGLGVVLTVALAVSLAFGVV
jgi:hypothetical protein